MAFLHIHLNAHFFHFPINLTELSLFFRIMTVFSGVYGIIICLVGWYLLRNLTLVLSKLKKQTYPLRRDLTTGALRQT